MHPLNAAAQATGWEADWAWSLPLIILTVVIHVFGLGLLHERVVHAVARIIARRHFTAMFAAVMGIAVLLITVLHATEAWVWALAYWVLGALPELRSSVLFSLGAMTTYGGSDVDLPAALATDGCHRGAQWDHIVWTDHCLSFFDDPRGWDG